MSFQHWQTVHHRWICYYLGYRTLFLPISNVFRLQIPKVQCQVTPSEQTSNVKLEIHAGATRPFRKLCNLTTMDKSQFKLGLSYAKIIYNLFKSLIDHQHLSKIFCSTLEHSSYVHNLSITACNGVSSSESESNCSEVTCNEPSSHLRVMSVNSKPANRTSDELT